MACIHMLYLNQRIVHITWLYLVYFFFEHTFVILSSIKRKSGTRGEKMEINLNTCKKKITGTVHNKKESSGSGAAGQRPYYTTKADEEVKEVRAYTLCCACLFSFCC